MKQKHKITILLLAFAITLSGCANLLEDYVEAVEPVEITPYVRPPVELITISDIDEFTLLLLEMIRTYESAITIEYQGADGEEIQAETLRVSEELLKTNPIAAYAVEDITVAVRRVLAYSEIDIEIEFKRTAEQIQSVIEVPTPLSVINRIFDAMSGYRDEAVLLTDLGLDTEEIANQVVELYYQNPSRVVMLPFVTVQVFPEETGEPDETEGSEEPAFEERNKVYEINFGYLESAEMLREIGENLSLSVRQNAAHVEGDSNGETLLSLANILMSSAEYDEGTARTMAMHGPQNIAATAFGALVRGSAVGEGYAMAFKALCDELRLDCRVVLGFYNDIYHAWNIVFLDGNYYHVDVALCDVDGLEAGFLKTDEDFLQMYAWGFDTAPVCDGPLTVEDFLPPEEEPADPEEETDPDNVNDIRESDAEAGVSEEE